MANLYYYKLGERCRSNEKVKQEKDWIGLEEGVDYGTQSCDCCWFRGKGGGGGQVKERRGLVACRRAVAVATTQRGDVSGSCCHCCHFCLLSVCVMRESEVVSFCCLVLGLCRTISLSLLFFSFCRVKRDIIILLFLINYNMLSREIITRNIL